MNLYKLLETKNVRHTFEGTDQKLQMTIKTAVGCSIEHPDVSSVNPNRRKKRKKASVPEHATRDGGTWSDGVTNTLADGDKRIWLRNVKLDFAKFKRYRRYIADVGKGYAIQTESNSMRSEWSANGELQFDRMEKRKLWLIMSLFAKSRFIVIFKYGHDLWT